MPSAAAAEPAEAAAAEGGDDAALELTLMVVSSAIALLGIGIAAFIWLKRREIADEMARRFAAVYRLLLNKYYVDEIYDAAIVHPTVVVSREGLWRGFDVQVVDGAVNGTAAIVAGGAWMLRQLQTGSRARLCGFDHPGGRADPRLLPLELMELPLLTLSWVLPLAGAVLLLLVGNADGRRDQLIRWIALAVSLVAFVVSLVIWARFDPASADFQLVERHAWIPAFGIDYFIGVDGISLLLVVLTAFLTPVALLSSWHSVEFKIKEFSIFILALEAAMIGVFLSLDLFLFYVFWDAMLIPMYFLIGIWGYDQRVYAAIKFMLYTMAGSVLMLVAILGLAYLHSAATGQLYLRPVEAVHAGDRARDADVVLSRVRPGVRDQGAALPVPHVAARRARAGADCWFRHPGRRAAEDGDLRPGALRVPAVPDRGGVLRARGLRCWR